MLKAKLIEEEPLKINLNVNYTTTKPEPAEGVLCLKGTVDTFESLPTENKAGAVYLVGTESPYNEYLWTGEAWEALSPKPEPMPDFVERSELTHATESLKSELAGELSKVSELAPKSELETLKSDFETKLAGVSELVEKLKESGGGEGGSGGKLNPDSFKTGEGVAEAVEAYKNLISYVVNMPKGSEKYALYRKLEETTDEFIGLVCLGLTRNSGGLFVTRFRELLNAAPDGEKSAKAIERICTTNAFNELTLMSMLKKPAVIVGGFHDKSLFGGYRAIVTKTDNKITVRLEATAYENLMRPSPEDQKKRGYQAMMGNIGSFWVSELSDAVSQFNPPEMLTSAFFTRENGKESQLYWHTRLKRIYGASKGGSTYGGDHYTRARFKDAIFEWEVDNA